MSTNLHEWFMKPRKERKTRKEAFGKKLLRLSRVSWLKNNSALITHHSELGESAQLKEIQR